MGYRTRVGFRLDRPEGNPKGQTAVLTIEFPRPPRELSPNRVRNTHHFAKARAVSDYRSLCAIIAYNTAKAAGWQCPPRARVALLWGLKGNDGTYRPADADNSVSAAKQLIDGLVDAGIIETDRWANMELGSVKCDKAIGPHIVVTVEALP